MNTYREKRRGGTGSKLLAVWAEKKHSGRVGVKEGDIEKKATEGDHRRAKMFGMRKRGY